jgi:tetratricopeptide (TPR) repeat protein
MDARKCGIPKAMFFEARVDDAPSARVPEEWGFIADAFHEGMIQDAGQTLQDQVDEESQSVPEPEVALLKGDVYRALGQEQLFHREIQRCFEKHKQHWALRIQWIRIRSMQNRLLAAERELDALTAESAGASEEGNEFSLVLALKAALYGQWGRTARARALIEEHDEAGGLEHAFSTYETACAFFALKDWKTALIRFRMVIEKCPRWPRPRIFVHHCLNALGQTSEALEVIEKACLEFPEDVNTVLVLLGHLYSTKDYKRLASIASERGFDKSSSIKNQDPNQRRPYLLAQEMSIRSLWHMGEFDKAIASAALLNEDWAKELSTRDRQGQKKRLPIRPLVQVRNMCVPACVAMILRALDPERETDPQVLFKQMDGSAGVAPWQLDHWLFQNKLFPIDVEVTIHAVRGMIDAGFPLLATRSHILTSHQELIVGYDDSLQEIEVLEPSHGAPVYVPYQGLIDSYCNGGESLLALIPVQDGNRLRYPNSWVDKEGMSARRIVRSIFTSRVDKAQQKFAELDASSLVKAQLELRFPDIFVPQSELPQRLKILTQRVDADAASRLGAALLLLDSHERPFAERALAQMRSTLPLFIRSYLIVLNARSNGRWRRMKRACQLMLERSASIAELWFLYSIALQGTGEYEAAQKACRICLEIDSSHLGANLERLSLPSQHIALIKQQEKIRTLLRYHPRSIALRAMAAQLAFDLGHAQKCEELLRRCTRLFPRSVTAYLPLRNFFLLQERPDLASAIVVPEDGQKLAPDAETKLSSSLSQSCATVLKLADAELCQKEPGAAVSELLRRRSQGLLTPVDDLALRQIELQFAFVGDNKLSSKVKLLEILPEQLPDPRASNLERMLSDLPLEQLTRSQAHEILGWSEKVMEGQEWTPHSRSLTAFVEEKAGRTANASRLYEALAKRFNLIHANYRLGIIHLEQGRLREAQEFFEKCIMDKPAHIGAWEGLVDIHAHSQQLDAFYQSLEELTQLLPYDSSRAHSLLDSYLQDEKNDEARSWLSKHGHRYPSSFAEWWLVKLHFAAGHYEDALESIGDALRQETPREAYAFELEIYSEQGRLADNQELIRKALQDFPDDIFFNHILATVLDHDPQKVLEIYSANFQKSPSTAAALEILKRLPAESILDTFEALIENCPAEEARVIAYKAFTSEGLGRLCIDLFERFDEKCPNDPFTVQILSENYRIFGLVRKNRARVEQLLNMDADNPDYLWLCALGSLDYHPKQARTLFIKYYELTADPEALAYLGRSEQLLGNNEAARKAYWQSLSDRRGDPWATSNLYRLGDRTVKLFSEFKRALTNPPDPKLQGFAVLAVDIAIEAQITLPESWEAWAAARARGLADSHNASPEEDSDLRFMLYIWCKRRRRLDLYEDIYGHKPRIFNQPASLLLKKWWWQNNWVPRLA